ncbi:hypothetical protein HHL11_05605 [Ramlibacter sp. G-1-2-2]|uniref:Uncharacterized protein n=1 Tax=Ramlibacter agri TaxID=2728837 RepID=A0A848GYH9_9BURK|nr:hypothetical protein [Ramlibacter agri]NML43217.1 hypothetical protein [Ramlibacter agri]
MRRAAVLLATLSLAGCGSIGPETVNRDRIQYVSAISDSWKRQMLLNLVRVRYGDVPVFLDVTSVINAYSLDQIVRAEAEAAPPNRGDTYLQFGGSLQYSDKPTITYVPLTGDKFARSIMSPIPVPSVLLLLQSGYPADLVLRFCVNSVNGVENSHGGLVPNAGHPEFAELLQLLREAQRDGLLGFEARTETGRSRTLIQLRTPADGVLAARQQRLRDLLRLRKDAAEYDVGYGSFPRGDIEIAMLTRSILQVMIDVGSYLDTPAVDVEQGRVVAPRQEPEGRGLATPVRVRTGDAAPQDSFVSVAYRGHWFWIDDRDLQSKAAFSFLMLLFSLTETSGTQTAPLITVPAR